MAAIEHGDPRQRHRRRARIAAATALIVIASMVPSAALAAPAMSFGTVSIGAVKTLTRTIPLEYALSDLPDGTVLYSGGDSTIDFGLASFGLSVPLTNTEVINEYGDINSTYTLTGQLVTGTDFELDPGDCATGTVSCVASVTFSPTAEGARTDSISWSMANLNVTGGGSLGSFVQLLAPFVASSVSSQLSISLDGIGVPSTDGVNARVDIAASAACIELNTDSIDFGSLTLGAEDMAASPTITVTNCSGTSETVYARATDASGPSSAWTLVDSAATCATDLGLDSYRLGLAVEAAPTLGLSKENKTVGSLAAGADSNQVARIWTACPGSTGAGVVMTMQLHYLVVQE